MSDDSRPPGDRDSERAVADGYQLPRRGILFGLGGVTLGGILARLAGPGGDGTAPVGTSMSPAVVGPGPRQATVCCCWDHLETLTPAAAGPDDRVGTALAVADGYLLVGAPGIDTSDDGAVYAYTRSDGGWSEQATLTGPSGQGNRFGVDIALSADGSRAVVGAPAEDGSTANAVVFERDGENWAQQTALDSPTMATGQYGEGVAVGEGGELVFVGDPGADLVSVYRFSSGGWRRTTQLTGAIGRGTISAFGAAIALDTDGTTAVIGAPGSNSPGLGSGAAFAFERTDSGWQQAADVTDVDGDSANYGTAVALAGGANRGFVGAPVPFPDTPNPAGYATIVDGDDGWNRLARLQTPTGDDRETLGTDIDVIDDGTLAAVGDAGDDIGSGDDRGSVSVFQDRPSGWCHLTTLTVDDGSIGDLLGEGVAVDGDAGVVAGGAPGATVDGEDAGAVYLFGCGSDEGGGTVVVDDFERSALGYDTLAGSVDDWAIQSDTVRAGQSALQYQGGTTPTEIVSFDGRPTYPSEGDRFRFDFRPAGDWDFRTTMNFGQQPNASFHDRYEIELDPAAGAVRLQYDDPAELADVTLGTVDVAFDRDTFYTVEVDWLATGSTMVLTIYDGRPDRDGSPVGQVAAPPPANAPSEGGIGFFANGAGDRWVYDAIRIVS